MKLPCQSERAATEPVNNDVDGTCKLCQSPQTESPVTIDNYSDLTTRTGQQRLGLHLQGGPGLGDADLPGRVWLAARQQRHMRLTETKVTRLDPHERMAAIAAVALNCLAVGGFAGPGR
jgi:hypothetical protein